MLKNFKKIRRKFFVIHQQMHLKIQYPQIIQFNDKIYTLFAKIYFVSGCHFTACTRISDNKWIHFDNKNQPLNKISNETELQRTLAPNKKTVYALYTLT